MKPFIKAADAFLFILVLLCPASAQTNSTPGSSQIEIAYLEPSSQSYQPLYERLSKRQVLEELQQFLSPLRLPRKLKVQVEQCGAPTRAYKPEGPVTVCYELVDQIVQTAAKLDPNLQGNVVVGAFIEVVLHELSHGVFDVLQVPVWGRIEDAADRLAAFIMLQFDEELALRTITGTAQFFLASNKTWTGSAFADVNSPEPQRFYNYLCIAYGGAPISFRFLARPDNNTEPILPARRAGRCASEYAQVRKAFDLRIMPFVDPDALVAIRSMQWLTPTDVK
jgi:Putative metallopeptidase